VRPAVRRVHRALPVSKQQGNLHIIRLATLAQLRLRTQHSAIFQALKKKKTSISTSYDQRGGWTDEEQKKNPDNDASQVEPITSSTNQPFDFVPMRYCRLFFFFKSFFFFFDCRADEHLMFDPCLSRERMYVSIYASFLDLLVLSRGRIIWNSEAARFTHSKVPI
jgi:hypothetical protein